MAIFNWLVRGFGKELFALPADKQDPAVHFSCSVAESFCYRNYTDFAK